MTTRPIGEVRARTVGPARRATWAVAAVFALSQGVPTVGIDYYAHGGGRGKVSELFDDRGVGDRVVTIADLDPERLVRMLADATATPRSFAVRENAGFPSPECMGYSPTV
mgnify:CR=1 FL=1